MDFFTNNMLVIQTLNTSKLAFTIAFDNILSGIPDGITIGEYYSPEYIYKM